MSQFAGFIELESSLTGLLLVEDSSNTPIDADALPTFRVYDANGVLQLASGTCALRDTAAISDATNANPIVVTSAGHNLTTGTRVTIAGVAGNTAANGTFIITKLDSDTFSLNGSNGSGAYTSGGTWHVTGAYSYTIAASGANGFEAGEPVNVLFSWTLSSTAQGDVHTFQVC